jgi:hypothetical protein
MLSTTPSAVAPSHCRFAFAAASVGLALSLIWTYIQGLRRNPYKHKNARIADLVLCLLATGWWVACSIILCIWTHAANTNGLLRADWRNGLCVLAWAEALFFAYLTATSALLVTVKSQKLFDKWETKRKLKQDTKQQAHMQKMQQEAAAADAARAAAGTKAPAAAAGPKAVRSSAAAAQVPPVATPPGVAADKSAWHTSSGAETAAAAEARPAAVDNPFLTEAPQRPMQPSADNV